MTSLYDGHITDLLRSNPIRKEPEVQALAYAILQEKRRLMDLVDQTRTMAAIDYLPERILDVLAVELRTPAYSEDLPIETKRKLIKGTLAFYSRLGTPWAVNWVIQTLFGNGHIEEWFDYGGTPHHFRVSAMNDGTFNTLEGLADFLRTVSSVKRLSSWLDEIRVDTDLGEQPLRIGGTGTVLVRIPMPEVKTVTMFKSTVTVGGSVAASIRMPMPQLPDKLELKQALRTGAAMTGHHSTIPVPQLPDAITLTHTGRMGLNIMGVYTTIPLPEIPD